MECQTKKKRWLKNSDLILIAISMAKIFSLNYFFQGLSIFAFEKFQ